MYVSALPIAVRVSQLLNEGYTQSGIGHELNREGFKTVRGKRWNYYLVKNFIEKVMPVELKGYQEAEELMDDN